MVIRVVNTHIHASSIKTLQDKTRAINSPAGSTSSIQRGDVIYYRGHIAIALGGGMMIDSWPHQGVGIHPVSARGNVIGAARPFI